MKFNILTKINNKKYNFFLPLTIFQACLEKKVIIPRFCYHSSLKIAGNCRMCLIEEKSSIKPLASCAVTLLNGMSIFTNTEVVKKAREGVLEYLLINHPLDCPICDQGGECDLQDQSMVFGSDTGRFYEKKRSTPNKNLGFLVKSFLNRCIHCARCTRFLIEIAGEKSLNLLGRGYKTEISNYVFKPITSELAGNIIDLCPVGALTSKPYSYKARVWELTKVYLFDIIDAFGANIQADFRGYKILRILPKINKNLNDEWISDRTRFAYDGFYNQRLTIPYFSDLKNYVKISWNKIINSLSFYFYKTFSFLKSKLLNFWFNYNFGAFLDFETALSFNWLSTKFHNKISANTQVSDFRKNFYFDTSSAFENPSLISSIFLLFINLRNQSPLLNVKVKKNNFFYKTPIFIVGFLSNFNYKIKHLGTKLKKTTFNFFKNKASSLLITNNNLNDFPKKMVVSNFITDLVLYETNIRKKNLSTNYLTFNFGKQEKTNLLQRSPVSVDMLHHVDDLDLKEKKVFKSRFLLPTKFYYEKFSTYVNNNFNFFDTMHHFSFELPGTREEWRVLLALYSKLTASTKDFSQLPNLLKKKYLLKTNKYLNLTFEQIFYFINKSLAKSNHNDFFNNNIVTNSSTVLALCSKKYNVTNDFIFTKW